MDQVEIRKWAVAQVLKMRINSARQLEQAVDADVDSIVEEAKKLVAYVKAERE